MRHLIIGCFLLLGTFSTFAQNFFKDMYVDRYFTVFGGTGQTGYLGDINYDTFLKNGLHNSFIGIEARLLDHWASRIEFTHYYIGGNDRSAEDSSYFQQRNLNFYAKNIEVSLQAIYYFKKYRDKYHKRWSREPYLMFGAGFTTNNPKTTLNDKTYNLRKLETEGVKYSGIVPVIPLALGIKFKINHFTDLGTELSYRFAFSDYLDDVSKNYISIDDPLRSQLSNRKDEIGIVNETAYQELIPGNKRGDNKSLDAYYMLKVYLSFYLKPANK